jgi:hypothetical protein
VLIALLVALGVDLIVVDNPVVVEFTADGAKIEVASKTEHRALVTGPLVTPPAPARSHT